MRPPTCMIDAHYLRNQGFLHDTFSHTCVTVLVNNIMLLDFAVPVSSISFTQHFLIFLLLLLGRQKKVRKWDIHTQGPLFVWQLFCSHSLWLATQKLQIKRESKVCHVGEQRSRSGPPLYRWQQTRSGSILGRMAAVIGFLSRDRYTPHVSQLHGRHLGRAGTMR